MLGNKFIAFFISSYFTTVCFLFGKGTQSILECAADIDSYCCTSRSFLLSFYTEPNRCWKYSKEKFYVKYLVQYVQVIIFISELTNTCKMSLTTWTRFRALASRDCVCLMMSFGWKRIFQRNKFLMQDSAEVDNEDDHVYIGNNFFVRHFRGSREVETSRRKCYSRLKFDIHVFKASKVSK